MPITSPPEVAAALSGYSEIPVAFTDTWVFLGVILTSKVVDKNIIKKIEDHISSKHDVNIKHLLLRDDLLKPELPLFRLDAPAVDISTTKEKVQASIKCMHLRAQNGKTQQEKQAARRKRNQDRRNRRKNK